MLKINNTNFKLLYLCTLAIFDKDKQQNINDFVTNNPINWESFFKIAHLHKLRFPIYNVINQLPETAIPASTKQRLKLIAQKSIVIKMDLTQELINIQKLFNENQIPVVFYKGAVFATRFYGNLGLRNFGDIDFLSRIEDFDRIEKLLLERGYKPEYNNLSKFKKKHFFKIHAEYNFEYFKNNRKVYHLEPHWKFLYPLYAIDIDLDSLEGYIQQTSLFNQKVNCFDINVTPIILAIHHGAKDGWSIFRHIFDWYVFMQASQDQIDWKKVSFLAIRFDVETYLYVSLALLEYFFNVKPPKELELQTHEEKIQKIAKNKIKRIEINTEGKSIESGFTKLIFRFKTSRKLITKLKIIQRIITTIPSVILLKLNKKY